MNKKGFTVIELIVSFTLVTVISIILFQLIFSLKELYVSGDIKTTLLNKQGIMVKKIYDDLNEDTLISITSCGVSCLTFKYEDVDKTLLVDVAANTLTYDNYTMKLSEGSYFDKLSFEYTEPTESGSLVDNSKFNLSVPIKSKFLNDEDFGIHVVKTYTKGSITINKNITVADATIVANGIPLEIRANNEIINGSRTLWTQIFYQNQNGVNLSSDDSYFKTYEEFIKTNSANKKSSLKSLDVFRTPCKYVPDSGDPEKQKMECIVEFSDNANILQTVNLLETAKSMKLEELKSKTQSLTELPKKESDKIEESYQNGFFELMLEYPSISATNYNLWTQTSNFATSSKLENVYAIDIVYKGQGCLWNGLKYINSKESSIDQYVNGCQGNTNFTIGVKKPDIAIKGPGGGYAETVNEVSLWINSDAYIDKYALSTIID